MTKPLSLSGMMLISYFLPLETHADTVRGMIEIEQNAIKQVWGNRLKEARTGDDQQSLNEHFYEHAYFADKELPRLQWSAQFILAYSTFEHILNMLCSHVKFQTKCPAGIAEMRGNGAMQRAKLYLKTFTTMEESFKSTEWVQIQVLGELRNAIAHEGGALFLDKKKKDLLSNRIKFMPGISYDDLQIEGTSTNIILSAEFVGAAITRFKRQIMLMCKEPIESKLGKT